ncbi:MAG TPA: pitrilysin family protein [Caulobacteraceae bacterium]|nr:pitrilysin family protein [Caulobacteraceae bacterium]
MNTFSLNRRSMLAGSLLAGASLTALSPAFARAQAAPGAGGDVFTFPTHIRDLPNGLRVIVIETGFPDIVSLQIPVSVGSRNEVEPGKSGFAHFFEHMMFRGTKNISATRFQQYLTDMGADSNAYTSDDRTNYHMTFNKEDLETALMINADRFQHLEYAEPEFRTEALAVLGEYNKNSANPISKLLEVMRDNAFTTHTYKHTTMGFLADIQAMPEQFAYSRQFFDRYYRPEFTAIIVAGDVKPEPTFALVEKYWGAWQPGKPVPAVPVEPAPNGPLYAHVPWPSETTPWVAVGFRGPAAYPAASNPNKGDQQALDVLGQYAFGPTSPLYQRLVLREQKVEAIGSYFPDSVDPNLMIVFAQPKKKEDIAYVREAIQAELAALRSTPADPARIDAIRSALKYGFAAGLDSTEAVADAIVPVVAATRDPQMLNAIYRSYDRITPADIQRVANKYFNDKGMIVTTLAHGDIDAAAKDKGGIDARVKPGSAAPAAAPALAIAARPTPAAGARGRFKELIQPTGSALIDVRMNFLAGSADDPRGKEGLAQLTAMMVTEAGSRAMPYEAIQGALYPLAAGFGAMVDKEMTTFAGTVHRDNADKWYDVIAGQLLDPGFRETDFTRVKSALINGIRVGLRGNNDEELGNEVLYEQLYAGHAYGHLNAGHAPAVEALTLDDVRAFHKAHYTQANLTLGVAGGASREFLAKARADLAAHLPAGQASRRAIPAAKKPSGLDVTLVQKNTRAAAISMGFPIEVKRGHPDFVALYLFRSFLGEHRASSAYLYQRMREIRGMNYGDYAYTEYFPGGMYQFAPPPNVARSQQAFRIWLRPVPPEQTHFAIRIAKFELDRLIKNGLSAEQFERTKGFLTKSTGLLTARQGVRLGYTLDQQFYGVNPDFTAYIRDGLNGLTREKVNAAIKRHLGGPDMAIVVITPQAEALAKALIEDTPSPIKYASEKPAEILAEDKLIEVYPLPIEAADVKIVPVEKVFEGYLFG